MFRSWQQSIVQQVVPWGPIDRAVLLHCFLLYADIPVLEQKRSDMLVTHIFGVK